MELTRRDFLGLGRGAAAAAVLAGLGLASMPRDARAIVGIDDALLGAVVVAVASLGGYALYNQFSGNLGLQAVGASFGNYVSSAPNRTAAAAAAAQIAATYGLTTTQERFSTAADSIASGAGAFADAMAAAADSGRLALDSLVSGSGELVGAFRELVGGWLSSGALGEYAQTMPGITIGSGTLQSSLSIFDITMLQSIVRNLTQPPISGALIGNFTSEYENIEGGAGAIYVAPRIEQVYTGANGYIEVRFGSGQVYEQYIQKKRTHDYLETDGTWKAYNYKQMSLFPQSNSRVVFVSPDLVVGLRNLPAIDRPVDAPDVIGAGWDSVPIATDMVISPTTGDIVSAGSITLPTGIPTTAGDYAAALQGALAGVVTDAIALPLALSVPVTVATPLGVESMPISQAISTETSLQLDYAPDIPISPVLPPVEVPEGPWTPAVELPFSQVWPFSMIYTFIDTVSKLGS